MKRVTGAFLTLLLASMLFSAIITVKSSVWAHDLEVSLNDLLLKNHLTSGKKMIVNMTVRNAGNDTESNVVFQLLINGSLKVSSTIDELSPNSFYSNSYSWSPTDGIYNLTVYAPPVTNETDIADNIDTKYVKACPSVPPTAKFNVSPFLAPPNIIGMNTIDFNASESNDDLDWGRLCLYLWDFGDGSAPKNETVPHTSHRYSRLENFTATLTVYDTDNEHSSCSMILIVVTPPTARFSASNPPGYIAPPNTYYVNRTVIFDAVNSSAGSKPIISYHWNFDDGNITGTSSKKITHVYRSVANYYVTLLVTDSYNMNNSIAGMIKVIIGRPFAAFAVTPSPYFINENLAFNASLSYDPDNYSAPNHGIIKYKWQFGDGGYNETADPIIYHSYSAIGIRYVNLTIVDYDSFSGSASRSITVSLRVYLRVQPTRIEGNPGEVLSLNVTIGNVEDLKSFNFKLIWPASWLSPYYYLLKYDSETAGDFLGPQRYDNGTQRWISQISYGDGFVFVNYTFTPVVPKRSGNGTLVTVRLRVISSGNATLDLAETKLANSTRGLINHSALDGYFYTLKPVADFIWAPVPCVINQTASLDASACYDPDDSLPTPFRNYTWRFDDGNVTSTTLPTITHIFRVSKTYNVTLTVVDDDYEAWSTWKSVAVSSGRDVAVLDVRPYVNNTAGILPIDVTVMNQGDVPESFNVSLWYYNITGQYFINRTLVRNLAHDSTEILTFKWNVRTTSKGNYTLRAEALRVEGETDLADNNCTSCTVRVYLQGDVDHDNQVGILDVVRINGKYGSSGSPGWIAEDLDCDGKITIYDIVLCTNNYGRKDQ